MPAECASAFAPGRVNLIGEHTDYNLGLALPFAIAEGVTVHAQASKASSLIEVNAIDLGESDSFAARRPAPVDGWRAFVRGIVAELTVVGIDLPGASIDIQSNLRSGSGLSSSAALEVALALALIEISRSNTTDIALTDDRLALARLCSHVENRWVGARTGLLDQLAVLYGQRDHASLIDFQNLEVKQVPMQLDQWRLVVMDSGEHHEHASSGYNQRR